MNPANEIQFGAGCLGFIWEEVARKILEEAIRIYNCTPEQAAALKQVFLKRGTYQIEISDN
jgi:O-acetyl-ADP-ribose deacetylase (regulator of RNase III)